MTRKTGQKDTNKRKRRKKNRSRPKRSIFPAICLDRSSATLHTHMVPSMPTKSMPDIFSSLLAQGTISLLPFSFSFFHFTPLLSFLSRFPTSISHRLGEPPLLLLDSLLDSVLDLAQGTARRTSAQQPHIAHTTATVKSPPLDHSLHWRVFSSLFRIAFSFGLRSFLHSHPFFATRYHRNSPTLTSGCFRDPLRHTFSSTIRSNSLISCQEFEEREIEKKQPNRRPPCICLEKGWTRTRTKGDSPVFIFSNISISPHNI